MLSPPLVNPFDGATRICVTLEDIANEGHGDNWLKAQYQQWTPSSARQYLNDLSLLDSSSSVDYNNLIEIDPELINRSIDFRSSRGLQHDFTMMFNKNIMNILASQLLQQIAIKQKLLKQINYAS